MSRWIEVEPLIDKAKEYGGYYEDTVYAVPLADIDAAPSIDIVRCGECKYRKNRIDYEKDYCIEHSKVIYNTDGYCSWAERSSE